MKTEYAVQIILALITAMTAISTTVMTLLFNRRQKRSSEREAQRLDKLKEFSAVSCGVRTLLWVQLDNIYKTALRDGYISVEDWQTVKSIYDSYHALGGNSVGTSVYNKLSNMPNTAGTGTKENIKKEGGSYAGLYN